MPAAFNFGGVNLGQVSSVSRSLSSNERDRTAIWNTEMIYGPGIADQELTIEIAGSLASVNLGQVGDATLIGESGATRSMPGMMVTELEENVDVGDGDTCSLTLRRALQV